METNDINNLERIRVRPLSGEERSRAWNIVAEQIRTAPTLSPFVFPIRQAVSLMAVFIFIAGTVGISDSARPGTILFPVDRAVEWVESALNPSSHADHARERLAEFDRSVATLSVSDADSAAPRTKTAVAPEMAMMMFATNDDASSASPLSDDMEQTIAATRHELERIMNNALLVNDPDTVAEIMMMMDEFEARVNAMREQ